jgi:alpha,alpha-trehalase
LESEGKAVLRNVASIGANAFDSRLGDAPVSVKTRHQPYIIERFTNPASVGGAPVLRLNKLIVSVLWAVLWLGPSSSCTAPSAKPETTPAPITDYIAKSWDVLTRSMNDCVTITDPKLATKAVLYTPADFPITPQLHDLEKRCSVVIRPLPKVITSAADIDTNSFDPQGLLYLPEKYVVPGGRFNEMYGWDSYFIIRGLIRDDRLDLARDIVENFFFEIDHYGGVLNANRTYYLSRSQQPFLSSMIIAIYHAEKQAGHEDRAWLQRAYEYARRDHHMWLRPELLAGDTGLSRYFDFGNGPAPESLKDEVDHYRQVAGYFVNQPDQSAGRIDQRDPGQTRELGPGKIYSLRLCDVHGTTPADCDELRELTLSQDFYKGDRAMRESGFDISFRFGPFGAATHHYAAVCLNSLLYKVELDLAEMSDILDHQSDALSWRHQASARRDAINKYLWNAAQGEFFDYDFMNQTQSTYQYLTTFYPLWTGLATPQQASAVEAKLKVFERPGGAMMSPYETGAQWDAPYAWAPLQMIVVDGLRRYGFDDDADRISFEFAGTVAENYQKQGYIVEKYNAETRSTDTAVTIGYQINVVGFGWTNAAYLEFLSSLHGEKRAELQHIH